MSYLIVVLLALAVLLLWQVVPIFVQSFWSPLRKLPGPPSPHWFFGNFKALMRGDASTQQERWAEQYGHTMGYNALFGVSRTSFSRSIGLIAIPKSFIGCGRWTPEL